MNIRYCLMMDMHTYQQIAIDVAHEKELEEVLQRIVVGLVESGGHALSRIWLLDTGDICKSCLMRDECQDQSQCLHLVASAGQSLLDDDQKWQQINGQYRRFPLGKRKVGQVGQTGQAMLLTDLTENVQWLRDQEWAKQEDIHSFAGHPLVFQGETLGVLAIFSRKLLNEDDLSILGGFSHHAAAAIANAKAFENIQQLHKQLELENTYLKEEIKTVHCCGTIVGKSNALQATLKQIELVAPTDSTVLVTGESGTGKELVARAIHQNSNRKSRPLVTVNCGSVPHELFESEFFGHIKGAFTGAVADRVGRFQCADGGTLFLDEVGEIPIQLQSKLLRVLQEGEFERIGDDQTCRVNVRIVAATNRDLKKDVDDKRFRQDLYYRLSVFPIHVVPLRERKEDIGLLAQHLMTVICNRLGVPPKPLKQKHILQLQQYDWPGNVRELQNTIERAIIISPGEQLFFDFSEFVRLDETQSCAVDSRSSHEILTMKQIKFLERENILRALQASSYKIHGPGGAAELMQIRPTTLASKIKAFGIGKREGAPQ